MLQSLQMFKFELTETCCLAWEIPIFKPSATTCLLSEVMEMPALDWGKHSKSFNNTKLKSNRFIW